MNRANISGAVVCCVNEGLKFVAEPSTYMLQFDIASLRCSVVPANGIVWHTIRHDLAVAFRNQTTRHMWTHKILLAPRPGKHRRAKPNGQWTHRDLRLALACDVGFLPVAAQHSFVAYLPIRADDIAPAFYRTSPSGHPRIISRKGSDRTSGARLSLLVARVPNSPLAGSSVSFCMFLFGPTRHRQKGPRTCRRGVPPGVLRKHRLPRMLLSNLHATQTQRRSETLYVFFLRQPLGRLVLSAIKKSVGRYGI